jgi:hypothetical protein
MSDDDVIPLRQAVKGKPKPPEATLVKMSTVEPRDVRWLWGSRIPAAMVTLFQGQEKSGKGFVVADLTARISTGRAWPAGVGTREPRDVILLQHEDAQHETIRPRLDAAGADCERVHLLTEIGGRWPQLPDDVALLEEAIIRVKAAMMVIDPASAYLGSADSNSETQARAALGLLPGVAERTGCAILLIRHLRKSSGVGALHRGIGSVAFTAVARAVMMLLPDPDDPAARVLTWPAVNVGAQPTSFRWRFAAPAVLGRPPAIEWDAVGVDLSADDILDRQDEARREPGALDDAVAWLKDQLADGPVASKELQKRAKGVHQPRTLDRARVKVGVVPKKIGKTWFTLLPSRSPTSPHGGDGVLGALGRDEEEERQQRQQRQDSPVGSLASLDEERQERQERQPGEDDADPDDPSWGGAA